MSAGCTIVASNTPPVREVIKHNESGRLIDFFDHTLLVEEICSLVENKTEASRLSETARDYVVANYDLDRICLPRQN